MFVEIFYSPKVTKTHNILVLMSDKAVFFNMLNTRFNLIESKYVTKSIEDVRDVKVTDEYIEYLEYTIFGVNTTRHFKIFSGDLPIKVNQLTQEKFPINYIKAFLRENYPETQI